MSRKASPEINAGSMADLAFLLLIFFLVTTTIDVDAGINRKISKKEINPAILTIKDKNIMEVNINFKNEVLVDGNIVQLKELKQLAIDFIDNAGGLDMNQNPCDWCNGQQSNTSSDHPTKAFISLKTDRNTSYESYLRALNNLNSAYTHLRNKLAVKLYDRNYESLVKNLKKPTIQTIL